MPCKNCNQAFESHCNYLDSVKNFYYYCPVGIVTPGRVTYCYYPMSNLEYLEYRYEKTQVIQ